MLMHVVRGAGLEPARHYWRQDLNLVRLPVSPPSLGHFLNFCIAIVLFICRYQARFKRAQSVAL
jgi:hypothetical protein